MIVIGTGNRFRKDDAAGLEVARRLRDRAPRDVVVVECPGDPAATIDLWKGHEEVILIDATNSGAAPGPGSSSGAASGSSVPSGAIRRFAVGDQPLNAIAFRGSTHGFGLTEAVELARALGELPGQVTLFGIEGKNFETGEGLSPEVAAAVEETVRLVLESVLGRQESAAAGVRGGCHA